AAPRAFAPWGARIPQHASNGFDRLWRRHFSVTGRRAIVRLCAAGPAGPFGNQSMSSPQVQQLIAEMKKQIGANSGLGGTLKFDFGSAGSVLIDGRSAPNTVSDGEGKSAD